MAATVRQSDGDSSAQPRSDRLPHGTPERRNRASGQGKSRQNQKLIRTANWTYISGLVMIAILTLTFHFLTDSIVSREQNTARLVNLSGRQRMLTQRMVRLAMERAAHIPFHSDAENQELMRSTLSALSETHQALTHGSAALGIREPASPAIREVYFGQQINLDARMQAFLACVRLLTEESAAQVNLSDPKLAQAEYAVHEPLLQALTAAVGTYQTSSEDSIRHLRRVLQLLTVVMLVVLLLEAAFLYRPLFKRLSLAQEELIQLGRTDPLTGSLNRRAFSQEAEQILQAARRARQPCCALMIDIDHFKMVNDRFGHPAGDLVINKVVTTLLASTSRANLVCRMGGEEFAILLRNSTLDDALEAAEIVRLLIEQTLVPLPFGQELGVTISLGVALLDPQDSSVFQLLQRADQALYRAKRNGRNRVEAERASPEHDLPIGLVAQPVA